jgi:hypothetical protein
MLKMLEIKAKGFLCLQLEVANMRVQRDVAGMKMLRFALDPAAEYLAAVDAVRRFGNEREGWRAETGKLKRVKGYPTRCEGYLQALGVSSGIRGRAAVADGELSVGGGERGSARPSDS